MASDDGIGIIKFLQGKNYFITGATGMIGKALVEKMLRTTLNVGKIFLLIKANNMDDAIKRLKNEIIDGDLFNCIREIYGKKYEEFMMEKIVPVVGSIGENGLGMDFNEANATAKQIHVIIHSAAHTIFDERYDMALNINTKGAARLLEFAKKCENLRLFLHISTANVNGEREGIIKEEALKMGHCIAWERNSKSTPKFPPPLDINGEIKLATEMVNSFGNTIQGIADMKHWGIQRAKLHGWNNIYQFTKAMAEMLVISSRENVQGNRVLDPTIISYGQNKIKGNIGDPQLAFDMVPLDMVVNAIIAVMAKHGIMEKLSETKIYQMTSSISNPVTYGKIYDSVYDYFTSSPLLDSQRRKIGIKKFQFFKTTDAYVSHLKIPTNGISEIESNTLIKRHFHFATLAEDYFFYEGRFDDENTRKLLEEMSDQERKTFGFDVKSIDWKHYIKNIHTPGLMRHVLKEQNKKISRL